MNRLLCLILLMTTTLAAPVMAAPSDADVRKLALQMQNDAGSQALGDAATPADVDVSTNNFKAADQAVARPATNAPAYGIVAGDDIRLPQEQDEHAESTRPVADEETANVDVRLPTEEVASQDQPDGSDPAQGRGFVPPPVADETDSPENARQ